MDGFFNTFIVIIVIFFAFAVAFFRKLELIRAAQEVLALPNMFAAGAVHRIGRPLLS